MMVRSNYLLERSVTILIVSTIQSRYMTILCKRSNTYATNTYATNTAISRLQDSPSFSNLQDVLTVLKCANENGISKT